MSFITDATLYVAYAPLRAEEKLIHALPFDSREQRFKKLPWEASGGTKGMVGDVYAAGFNYVLPEDLVAHLTEVLGDQSDAVLVARVEGDPPEVYLFGEAKTA